MRFQHQIVSIAAGVALAALAMPVVAQDAAIRQNASGFCQGALPQFAGSLRARPLGIKNEGTTAAFVSCALPGAVGARYPLLQIFLVNHNATQVSASCTIVSGRSSGDTPTYYPLTGNLSGNGVTSSLTVPFPVDDSANVISFNCNLPPMVEITYIRQNREVP